EVRDGEVDQAGAELPGRDSDPVSRHLHADLGGDRGAGVVLEVAAAAARDNDRDQQRGRQEQRSAPPPQHAPRNLADRAGDRCSDQALKGSPTTSAVVEPSPTASCSPTAASRLTIASAIGPWAGERHIVPIAP